MPTTLHVDEAGREREDRDFIVGGALVARRMAVAARLRRVPFAWPFLARPLHRAPLRCAGHLAQRWWAWAETRAITDPSPELGLFGGEPADRAREMWERGWFDEHLRFQTWVARAGVATDDAALVPAAFFRLVTRARSAPPNTTDIGALNRWARAAGLRGPPVERFKHRILDTVLDALTAGGSDLSIVVARDAPSGSTLGDRDRFLRMLGATLEAGEELGATRARVQPRTLWRAAGPGGPERVPLDLEHIQTLGVDIDATVVSPKEEAEPGDEAINLLLGPVRRAGAAAVAPVRVRSAAIAPARGTA